MTSCIVCILESDIGCANLVAEIVTTRNHVSSYTITMGAEVLSGDFSLRRCETPLSPPSPDPVGIENCKQLFSQLLAFTTQKIATHDTDIISAVCVAVYWVVNASRNEKSCLQLLIPTAVFHILLSLVPMSDFNILK